MNTRIPSRVDVGMDFTLPNVMRSTFMDALACTTHIATIVLLPKVS